MEEMVLGLGGLGIGLKLGLRLGFGFDNFWAFLRRQGYFEVFLKKKAVNVTPGRPVTQ